MDCMLTCYKKQPHILGRWQGCKLLDLGVQVSQNLQPFLQVLQYKGGKVSAHLQSAGT